MTTPEREARIRALLEKAPALTDEERRLQQESRVYGNVKIDEPAVTRADVIEAIARLR